MSDKNKFNLKNYQKIDGGVHIDMRLKESREKAPDVINEKQLEDYRAGEAEVIVEKLLEQKRTGGETEITEKRLDTHKSKFANKYRNPGAYEGDMNKLEEQRLSDDPSENEKYEAASETPKQFRWWEDVKSPDGLKLAKKNVKTAQEEKKEVVPEVPSELSIPTEKAPVEEEMEIEEEEKEEEVDTDFDIYEDAPGARGAGMFITVQKFNANPDPTLSNVYLVLSYDANSYGGDAEAIKEAALEKITAENPMLGSLLGIEDFYGIKEINGEGIIKVQDIGPEFAPIVGKYAQKKTI